MPRKKEAFVIEIIDAVAEIRQFVGQMDLNTYQADAKTKAAVERKLLVIGEAFTQLKRLCPNDLVKISDIDRIIAFRNILVHAYFGIDDGIVWDVVRNKLATLEKEVRDHLS